MEKNSRSYMEKDAINAFDVYERTGYRTGFSKEFFNVVCSADSIEELRLKATPWMI
jgi:hypothetical protein